MSQDETKDGSNFMSVPFSRDIAFILLAACLTSGIAAFAQESGGQRLQPAPQNPSPFPMPALGPAPTATATPAPAPMPSPMPAEPAPAAGQVTEQVTKEGLDQLKSRLDAATDLSEAQKSLANEYIEKSKAFLQQKEEHANRLRDEKQRTESLELERRAEQARVDAAIREQPSQPDPTLPVPQLEQLLASKQQELVQAQTELALTEKRLTDRTARQKFIKERLSAIPLQVDQIKSELSRPNTGNEPPVLVAARRQALLAELIALESEPAALQSESAFLVAQEAANLIQLRRQGVNAALARLKEEVAALQIEVQQKKSSDAQYRARIARHEANNATIPELKAIYDANAKTVESELRIREEHRRVAAEIAETKQTLETVQRKWEELRQREKSLGSSTSFGIRLREQRRFLPDLQELHQQIRERGTLNEQAHLGYIEAREKRAELDHLNQSIETLLNKISTPDDTADRRRHLEDEIREAYELRQNDLAEEESALENYVSSLDQLDIEQSTLIQQVVQFQKYIDERILWVPTHRLLTWSDMVADFPSLQRVFQLSSWKSHIATYSLDVRNNTPIYLIAVIIWATLLATQGIQRAKIKEFGQKASSRLNTSMRPTWATILWTYMKTLAAPLPLLFFAWRGRQSGSSVHEFAHLLLISGVWLWWLEAVRLTCRTGGLGPAHFQWSDRVSGVVNRQLSWFISVSLPLTLLIIALKTQSIDGQTDAIERFCVVLFLLMIAYTMRQITRKRDGIFYTWIEDRSKGWGSLFAFLIQFILISLPIFLAGLSITGYTFAQGRLTVRLGQTLILITGAVFARSLLFRWLTIRQRRLSIAHARETRAALQVAQAQEDGSNAVALEAHEARTNLAEVSTQSKRLLNTTIIVLSLCWIWLIWQDVLPSLQRLDQFTLPGTTFTLDKVFNALLQIILFTTAARNIPGLIEITLLERLPLDRSSRYAVGAILRYMIAIIGVSAVGNTLDLKWEKLQWLVAALTFSLGFGLQEIFANFVSGLIILFEQPIRVGDVVTLDNVTGTVNRIRIRSTSIVDYDRKEYIVPNKEFITGKVLNWTLTDTVNRVVINVGTAHTANPDQVREIIRGLITTQPHVLSDPSPFVACNGIHENALNFIVGVYLPSMEFRTETSHTLYARILQAFREAGIELAQPQRVFQIQGAIPVTVARTSASEPTSEELETKTPPVAATTPVAVAKESIHKESAQLPRDLQREV